ncbi:tyrosine-type recombinase/integrase [Polynucleobacter sp. JS-JIR-II-c23]|uniref:tyrosine-type recombinase/integrase n=1 Tax=Polynucleobacter sp. JS-JIR-II-c23 TaxID=1758393 RepID=UPI002B22AF9D|nr:tyrosine-type recombinase/integrase [Polynucleobacter sp. JS-JIR-II-c23]MEA9604400.1 tyrosine-type recombinase/integrase [Polynucleobacter sp. JS-JIR-II-c23]
MPSKKIKFNEDEIAIFDDAVIYKRGNYWQFRIWLAKERKYARFSLKTKSRSTAEDKAKLHYHELMALQMQGKSYFSKTTKDGVAMYLEQRQKDVEAELIVKGRYSTISTHLEHWLNHVKKDTKLKELERTDCENYFAERTKTKKGLKISQTTVENEQSTINAMMAWLYKRKETYIDGFDFKKLPKLDRGKEENRRDLFTDAEFKAIADELDSYIEDAEKDLSNDENLVQAITGYYLGFNSITGLRRGEQLQLRWSDIEEMEHKEARNKKFDLLKITIRGETSKVRKTRKVVIKDTGYFAGLLKLQIGRLGEDVKEKDMQMRLGDNLMFSANNKNPITPRAIGYHFDKLLKLAKIKNLETRDLVPYSFRHYFITKRVNSNLPPAAVAEMCGTSITQIEKTYYHTTEEKMVSNALADYEYKDGLLIPK